MGLGMRVAEKRPDWSVAGTSFMELADALLWGSGVSADAARAHGLYVEAAKRNFAPAELGLGISYQYGLGVPMDYAAAERWFRRSLAHGYANAQYSLDSLALSRSTPLTGPQRALPQG